MSDSTLRAITSLQGFRYECGNLLAEEPGQKTIVSLAFASDSSTNVSDAIEASLDMPLPVVGQVSRSNNGISLLRLQSDQCFLVTDETWPDPAKHLHSLLGGCAYYTDQSDSWAMVDITGKQWPAMMERICQLDLSDHLFTTSHVVRTTMEHMSVIIERPGEHQLRLYSPRSSAKSFAHAIATSMRYVSPLSTTEE